MLTISPPLWESESISDQATSLIGSGFNLVLQMPTGTGKTHRAATAIHEACNRGRRAIYLAPTRALANELHARWSGLWEDLKVGIFTGDYGSEQDYPVPFVCADVLIMTPERLDICTRQWRHYWKWLPLVDLLVVDEIHLLADPNRGARLEGTVIRMRELNPFVRVLGLSATLGNGPQLAEWLDGIFFQSTQRKIQTEWKTVVFSKADEKPQRLLEVIQPVVARGAKSLVFVQSKRRAEHLAMSLRTAGIHAEHHHGGLDFKERAGVEERFRNRVSDVLIATGTLEVGLNLPVRQVVLYDMQQFDGMDFRPLSVISAWQRAGRAGRPGQDDKGEVVIFRARWEKDQQYSLGRFEPIHSHLASRGSLTEQVIVSVAAGYSRTRAELKQLLNKSLAATQGKLIQLDQQVDDMCVAGFLREEGVNGETFIRLKATSLGRLCSRLLISPDTVLQLKCTLSAQTAWTNFDLLLLCCALPDFELSVTVDFEELTALGESLVRRKSYLLSDDGQSASEKLSIPPKRLLSAVKGALILLEWTDGWTIEQIAQSMSCYPNEVTRLKESSLRMLTAMRSVLKETSNDDSMLNLDKGYLDKKAARLELMLAAGLDEDASTLTMVTGIGKTWAAKLVEIGILDLEMLAQSSEEELQKIGNLSAKRAGKWIDEASRLLSSDDLTIANDFGKSVTVVTSQIELPVDVYRLKRSWQLRVEEASEPQTYLVTGGSDPHLVRQLTGAWSCDCPDRSKGHECKHLIAVRRWKNDPVIMDIDKSFSRQNSGTEINLRSWWSR